MMFYQYKLIPIAGDYRLLAPIEVVPGVGKKTAESFEAIGIKTVGDLLKADVSLPSKLQRLREEIKSSYQ